MSYCLAPQSWLSSRCCLSHRLLSKLTPQCSSSFSALALDAHRAGAQSDDSIHADPRLFRLVRSEWPGCDRRRKDVSYEVDVPQERFAPVLRKRLLNKVSGFVQSGMLVALLG